VTSLRVSIDNQQTSTSTTSPRIDLDMMKAHILTKIKRWKSSRQLSWHKEIRRKELIKAILLYKYLQR